MRVASDWVRVGAGLLRRNSGAGRSVLKGRPFVVDAAGDTAGDTAVLFPPGPGVTPAEARALYGACSEFRGEFDAICRVADR